MPKFIVQQPLKHNGDDLTIGDTVELSAKDAKPLLAADILLPTPEKPVAATKQPTPPKAAAGKPEGSGEPAAGNDSGSSDGTDAGNGAGSDTATGQ